MLLTLKIKKHMKKNYIQKALVVASFVVIFAFTIFSIGNAADVTLTTPIDIVLTVGTQQVTFQLQSGSMSSFSVDSSRVSFSTGSGQTAVLLGPEYISFGNTTGCDNSTGKSKIEIPENTSVIVTPSIPATTDGDYSNTCKSQKASGGTGSGGSSGSGSGTSNTSNATNNNVNPSAPAIENDSADVFIDLPGTGAKKLNNTTVSAIYIVVKRMIDSGAYRFPLTKKFNAFQKTTRYFAIQNALAVAGAGCGRAVTYTSCRNQASELGIVDQEFVSNGYINRAEYFGMLIKAANITLVASKEDIAANLYSDVTPNSPIAPVVATAKISGIAPGKSALNAKKQFPRYASAIFAANAIKVKK